MRARPLDQPGLRLGLPGAAGGQADEGLEQACLLRGEVSADRRHPRRVLGHRLRVNRRPAGPRKGALARGLTPGVHFISDGFMKPVRSILFLLALAASAPAPASAETIKFEDSAALLGASC